MSKASTDTATERHIAEYRESGRLPAQMTLRFVALLTKKELARLARIYDDMARTRSAIRLYRARHRRIQSERRQRGHIK